MLNDGRLAVKLDKLYDVLVLSAQRISASDVLPEALVGCAGCHQVRPQDPPGSAPSLAGVLDREIASDPGYGYSAGLSALDGTWTEERLARYLAAPEEIAAGTSMPDQGLSPEQAAEAAAALRSVAGD